MQYLLCEDETASSFQAFEWKYSRRIQEMVTEVEDSEACHSFIQPMKSYSSLEHGHLTWEGTERNLSISNSLVGVWTSLEK